MVQVKWTLLAVDDLRSIFDYIARDSKQYAKIQVIRLRARTKILKTYPFSGKLVPEYNDENYRELDEGNYRIIYKIVNPKRVDVLTIHHAARDLNRRNLE